MIDASPIGVPGDAWPGLRRFLLIAMVVHLLANWLAGLYGPVWQQASIREAQRLLVAGALARNREVFMLDMGEPVRIMDLANRMISLAGYRVGTDIEIQITGLRPGEKLSEELNTAEEQALGTSHPEIVELHPPLLDRAFVTASLQRLARSVDARDDALARDLLFEVANWHAPSRCSDVGPVEIEHV